MAGAQGLGHSLGIGGFIKLGVFKSDGESPDRLDRSFLHQGNYQRGINAPRNKGSNGYIRHQLATHRIAQQGMELLQGKLVILHAVGNSGQRYLAGTPPFFFLWI